LQGNGFRLEVRTLVNALQSAAQFQRIIGRYAAGFAMQIAQTAACNRLYTVEKRLARWLLLAQDRVDSETLKITHDFLATMLGTDQPSVTLA
jgi:CRP-like cAMP-binding protein